MKNENQPHERQFSLCLAFIKDEQEKITHTHTQNKRLGEKSHLGFHLQGRV